MSSELSEAIVLSKPFTDELSKLGFEWRIQARKGDKYLDIKTDGFKEKRMKQ